MKKLILGILLGISIESFAQQLPNPRPCRVSDVQGEEILFLALGNPSFETIKQGDFDINKDEVKLSNTSLLSNYYKDNLKVNFFKPIDKSVFKHSVSGWCSWYYYYQLLDYKESILNVNWLAKNLKDYQLEYIQIDDAWQDKGKGNEDNRDWTNINERFKKPGMDSLARYIKNVGLKPALWIVPHGQSNLELAKKSKTFMLDKNDKSEITGSWNWVGNYQLDPTSKNMESYLKNLFSDFKFTKGYDYFKIDGQSLIFPDYTKNTRFFENPKIPAIAAYRNTLKAIRNTVGNETYLLGCWRTPIEGIGYFNATRSNGDVWASNTGFRQVLEAVRAGYFLHNTAWYVDPDPVMVGAPLSVEMARTWASIVGLTGMATFCSERMPDLAPARVDILKKILPAANIYPVDLFRYAEDKSIYDLKIAKGGRNYDVVGIFNFNQYNVSTAHLQWEKLGLDKLAKYHVFDFWANEYLGCFDYGLFINLNSLESKVLSIVKATDVPELISTNRHITQGWVEIDTAYYNSKSMVYKGISSVIAGELYEIKFAMPATIESFEVARATFGTTNATVKNSRGCSYISFIPSSTGKITWEVNFKNIETHPVITPGDFPRGLEAVCSSLGVIRLEYEKTYGSLFSYRIDKNGMPLGYALTNPVYINQNNVDQTIDFKATQTNSNNKIAEVGNTIVYKPSTQTCAITTLKNIAEESDVAYKLNQVCDTSAYEILFYGNGSKTYYLNGVYDMYDCEISLENASSNVCYATFEIIGDGKSLWKSSLIKSGSPAIAANINVSKVKALTLKITPNQENSDWLVAKWRKNRLKLIAK